MQISVAALRKKLTLGSEFLAEMVGAYNTRNAKKDCLKTRRKVLQQNNREMCSTMLDGSGQGEAVCLNWRDVTVESESNTVFTLTKTLADGSTDTFLRITLLPKEESAV